jgi:Type I phosphodiesterase / nucleotide pyrophosphatase
MSPRALLALCAAVAVFAYLIGDAYIDRLPNHRGYFLVPVEDAIAAPAPRPRRAVVILVDGLSRSFAEGFASRRRIEAEGQCRTMVGGPITVSRPMYAVLSTGLEEDRSGCRNNDETTPLAADSIWQSARRSGRVVTGLSAVRWWQQLFPDGFDRYDTVEKEADEVFGRETLRDLSLVHPLYVDEMGHHHGAASPEYREAAHRADLGVMKLLDGLDLSQDLVVLTADHGHTSYGGHGGPQREIAEVLTCFAGPGVARRGGDAGVMDAQAFAPALAVLLGVPFPRNMRAGEDHLDTVFDIADTRALPATYVADRRAAVERFRAGNREALARWLGPGTEPTWSSLYAREEGAQRLRFMGSAALLVVALYAAFRRRGLRALVGFLIWSALTLAATLAGYAALRKGLDFTSINAKAEFLRAGVGVSVVVGAISLAVHRRVFADERRRLLDEITLVVLLALATALHPFVYGWPIGFPLPGAHALFFPFLAPVVLLCHAVFGGALCVMAWRRKPVPA